MTELTDTIDTKLGNVTVPPSEVDENSEAPFNEVTEEDTEEYNFVANDPREEFLNSLLIAAPDDVAKWKAADRDAAIFALLQSLVGEYRALNFKVTELESWIDEKREQFSDPEKMKEMMGQFLQATPFGGLLG